MYWFFNSGKIARKMKNWRFIFPLSTALGLLLVAELIDRVQGIIYGMSQAAQAGGPMTTLDWMSLTTAAVGALTLIYAFYQAYQDHNHAKWQEVAWQYDNGYDL